MVNVAVPADSVPLPSVVEPSLNVTVPVAVLGDTVAVSVIDWPNVEGFADDESVVVVLVLFAALASIVGLSNMKIVPVITINKRLIEKTLASI